MEFVSNSVAILGVIAMVLLYKAWRLKNAKTKSGPLLPPEIQGGLPLIGHLHKLGGNKPLFRILADFADKYGPIFMIRLGVHRTVVINNYKIMKELFATNDRFLASRPQSSAGKHLGYNYAAVGFSPYGPYWRDLRKLTVVELLSAHKIRTMKHVQVTEVSCFIRNLFLQCKENNNDPVKVDMSRSFKSFVLNFITMLIVGKRYCDRHGGDVVQKGRHIAEIIKDYMLATGAFVPSDMVPFLRWIDFLGPVKNMKKILRELDDIMESWIEEHESKANSNDDNKDFMDVLLSSTIEDDSQFGNSRRVVIKATVMAIIVGGTDSTSSTLTWCISNLLSNRRILKVAQEEIDEKVGRERIVEESDIEKLVYVDAVIKETLRILPPGPLAIPREAMEDCTLYGYHIPKGTRFLPNLWKLHRDPNVWENPEEFKPERFLTSNANVNHMGQHFEYLPFTSGRRSCPGGNLAMQVMQLTVARFLQGFNLTTPNDEPVDMTETLGITLSKKTPLHVMLTPRLAPHLYE